MGKEPNCEECSGKPPKLLKANLKFFETWSLISNCFQYCGTMDGIYPMHLDWQSVESVFRLYHKKPYRLLLKKIKLAEKLTIENALKRSEK